MAEIDLDDAYEIGKYIQGAAEFPPKWAQSAAVFRDRMAALDQCQLDLRYGDHDREVLDLFLPDAQPRGLVVFVHGGYWKAFDKSSWSHLAAGALERGYAVAVPSYVLAPTARIWEITRQITAAIDLAARHVAGPIFLTGHSAGGHLVSRMLCRDVGQADSFADRIARVVSISGVHDLRPLLQTKMNQTLNLSVAEADRESPLLHRDVLTVPLTAFVGGNERPMFIQQARWMAEAWPSADLHIEPGCHHFNVIQGLQSPTSNLLNALLG